jgi:hypothetical protein
VDPIAEIAATAVVTAMTTDLWEQAQSKVVDWWRTVRPKDAGVIRGELVETRTDLEAARTTGESGVEALLAADWQTKLRRILRDDPAAAESLRRLVDEELAPMLPDTQQAGPVTITGNASGFARVYQAGRDLNLRER